MAFCKGDPDEEARKSGKKPLRRIGLGGPSRQKKKEGGSQFMQL